MQELFEHGEEDLMWTFEVVNIHSMDVVSASGFVYDSEEAAYEAGRINVKGTFLDLHVWVYHNQNKEAIAERESAI